MALPEESAKLLPGRMRLSRSESDSSDKKLAFRTAKHSAHLIIFTRQMLFVLFFQGKLTMALAAGKLLSDMHLNRAPVVNNFHGSSFQELALLYHPIY